VNRKDIDYWLSQGQPAIATTAAGNDTVRVNGVRAARGERDGLLERALFDWHLKVQEILGGDRGPAEARRDDFRAGFNAGYEAVLKRFAPVAAVPPSAHPDCWCETCRPITLTDMRMVLCPECGNKRCPRATNHENACTGSNEVGQKGSSWESVKPWPGPKTERAAIIRRAHAAWEGKWPETLSSGVMFFYGERITRAEFEAVK
jgi:hypothetical protein